MEEIVPAVLLENGIRISFEDRSNRYFGDFHRICVLVSIVDTGDTTGTVKMERTLEKMGVVTAQLESERQTLINTFLESSRSYLEKESFPEQLKRRLIMEKKRPVFLRNL